MTRRCRAIKGVSESLVLVALTAKMCAINKDQANNYEAIINKFRTI